MHRIIALASAISLVAAYAIIAGAPHFPDTLLKLSSI